MNYSRERCVAGRLSPAVVVRSIEACSVTLRGRYWDGSIVIDRSDENRGLPGELLFQQEVGQQGWGSLKEDRTVGDLLEIFQGGRKVCVGPESRSVEGGPASQGGQARGQQLNQASCLGRWREQRGGVGLWVWELGQQGGFGLVAVSGEHRSSA